MKPSTGSVSFLVVESEVSVKTAHFLNLEPECETTVGG